MAKCWSQEGLTTFGALARAQVYDPKAGSWTDTGSLIGGRGYHTATLLPNGKVLVAGGLGEGGPASAQVYDPEAGSWTATGSLIGGRFEHTATLLPNGKVLVAGGQGGGALASAEAYDPATGTWTATGSLIGGRFDTPPRCFRMAMCWSQGVSTAAAFLPARRSTTRQPLPRRRSFRYRTRRRCVRPSRSRQP